VGKFAKLIGKSVRIVQRWDKDGLLVAKHSATGRRFYTQLSICKIRSMAHSDSGVCRTLIPEHGAQ